MTPAWSVPAGLQSCVSSSFQWSIDSCQFAKKKIENVSPATRETRWKEGKTNHRRTQLCSGVLPSGWAAAPVPLMPEMNEICDESVLPPHLWILFTLEHHRPWLLGMDLCSAPVGRCPSHINHCAVTIDINWHPCCSLQGEAKDLMGIESELFPDAPRCSHQGCADTHGHCQTPELPPLVIDLLHWYF